MCGIFGIVSEKKINENELKVLAHATESRGKDSSGFICFHDEGYFVNKSDLKISSMLKKINIHKSNVYFGHSRLVTNGLLDNQPIIYDDSILLHNGIITNYEAIWDEIGKKRKLKVDSEIICALTEAYLSKHDNNCDGLGSFILERCNGVANCALILPKIGKLCLFSNSGSLFIGLNNTKRIFASEKHMLEKLKCTEIEQVFDQVTIEIPKTNKLTNITEKKFTNSDLIPSLGSISGEEKLLNFVNPVLHRCTKCILPSTMPFINFDKDGVCNYCNSYKLKNQPKPKDELLQKLESYRRHGKEDCIVPFSGGRDSCYALHIIINDLNLKPITYTYDWGMVTDLGRRNISRMCSKLGIENIIVAADIRKKRQNIRMNLSAWLKSPDLGMVSILTAGDKHFFKYVEDVKRQTGINLNIWGANPLEVTHFKSGFLGIKPNLESDSKRVFIDGKFDQLNYQLKRYKAMTKSPGYFNSSIFDTLSGEYYRSFSKKSDYFDVYEYWQWDEDIISNCLENYEWEKAPDTKTTWRIGDGTAAFYNYIYYVVAGFTEHDTFRSNQIREGQISRSKALELVEEDNIPRYPNIKWYLDAIDFDFREVIKVINNIPKLYNEESN